MDFSGFVEDEKVIENLKTEKDFNARLAYLGEQKEFLFQQVWAQIEEISKLDLSEEDKIEKQQAVFAEHMRKDDENFQETLELLRHWPKDEEDFYDIGGEG